MLIIKSNRIHKRVKCGILATMGILLTLGLTKPVEAAVSQSDLAAPVMDEESHTYKIGANPTVEESNQYHRTAYHYVYFGMYPQREITGAELTDEIRNATYDNNGDATVKGRKYRRINYFQTGIKRVNQSDPFYEEDWAAGCIDGYRYFIYEPIRWRILSNNGNTLLLQTEQGIDTQPFSCAMSTDGKDFWAKCDLRKWLNYNGEGWHTDRNHFYYYRNALGFYCYAFSAQEQAKIQTTHLTQDKYPKFDTEGGMSTDDKIFILNYTDLNNSTYGFCEDKRCFSCNMKYTDYGYATIGNIRYNRNDYGYYWIRTLGSDWRNVMYAGYMSGYKCGDGYYYMYVEAVRPATNVSYNLSECFKITFDTGTNEQIEPQVMLTSSVAKEPATPLKNGYTFVGWYIDKECTKPYDFVTKLSKDTTLYAGWKDPNSTTSGGKTDVVTPQEMETAEKITAFNVGKASYKILSKDANTVSYKVKSGSKKSLKSVTIPDTVKYKGITYKVVSIEAKAFKDCKKLTKVTIGKHVTSIGKQAFASCKKLKTITVKTKKLTKNTIGKNAFKGIDKRATFKLPKSLKGKKYTTYKKVFKQKKIGYKKTMKIKKG